MAVLKAVVIMLAIVAIICALDIYDAHYIDSTATGLLGSINETRDFLKAGDAAQVSERVHDLRNRWEGMESHWEALVDHREIDRIDTLMTHLEAMADTAELDTMMPELDELAFYLTHIDDKHKLRPENIL